MAKSNKAVFPQIFGSPYSEGVTTAITATTRVWTNDCKVIYEAPADDTKIGALFFKATGQVAACNVVVFISDVTGTTFEPKYEEVLAAAGITPSATTKSANCEIPFQLKELYLQAGQKIGFGITANVVTGKVVGWVDKGDYGV